MRRIIIYIIGIYIVVLAIFLVFKRHDNEEMSKPIVVDEGETKSNESPDKADINSVKIDTRIDEPTKMASDLNGWINNLKYAANYNPNAKKILDNRAEFSDSLLRLASNRVDAIDFVVDAEKNKGKFVNETTESYKTGRKIPLFIQWDPRFGYKFYEDYFAAIGCGPTSVSMILNGYGEKKTPIDMMDEMKKSNAYIKDVGTSWDGIKETLRNHGMVVDEISLGDGSFKKVLKEGKVVLLSMKAGKFTTGGHYLLLTGLDENNKFIMNDPNSIRYSLKSWDFQELAGEIKGCWSVYK